jgi:FMN-dependent NADH-azoreductase
LADDIVTRLRATHPQATLRRSDLALTPHPPLDQATLDALSTPAEARTAEQAARVALDDAPIHEVQAADVIVLGVPMYNFGISSQSNHWVDAIARAGVTFRYTKQRPEGLLKEKSVYVALTRGGRYRGTAADSQTPYLKTLLGLLGMKDVRLAYAEGLNMSEDAAQQGLAEARSDIACMFV